jgi:ABC-type uncharacterized transport system substrate-binding protein
LRAINEPAWPSKTPSSPGFAQPK